MGTLPEITVDLTYFYATGGVLLTAMAGIWVFRKVKGLISRG